MDIDAIKQYSNTIPHNKQELFLCLCAQNLLNKLIKQEEYANKLHYWEIKMSVSMLALNLINMEEPLYEELAYNNIKECIYIRCYGSQFSFHKVQMENMTPEQLTKITDNSLEWDRIELQPVAEDLYQLAISSVENGMRDVDIINEIKQIIEKV